MKKNLVCIYVETESVSQVPHLNRSQVRIELKKKSEEFTLFTWSNSTPAGRGAGWMTSISSFMPKENVSDYCGTSLIDFDITSIRIPA